MAKPKEKPPEWEELDQETRDLVTKSVDLCCQTSKLFWEFQEWARAHVKRQMSLDRQKQKVREGLEDRGNALVQKNPAITNDQIWQDKKMRELKAKDDNLNTAIKGLEAECQEVVGEHNKTYIPLWKKEYEITQELKRRGILDAEQAGKLLRALPSASEVQAAALKDAKEQAPNASPIRPAKAESYPLFPECPGEIDPVLT